MNNISHPFQIDKTMAALNKIVVDVKNLRTLGNIILPLIMITYYIISIFSITQDTTFIILKSVALGLVVTNFLFDIIVFSKAKKNKAVKKIFKRSITYLKILLRIVTVGFTIYELVTTSATDLQIISIIITLITIAIQILIEAITLYIESYMQYVNMGFEMDREEIANSWLGKAIDKASHPKTTLMELLDIPLATLAQKSGAIEEHSDETSATESKHVAKMRKWICAEAGKMEEKRKEKKLTKQEQNKAKREEKLQDRKARYEKAVEKFKMHLKALFKPKNKK